MKTEEPQMHPRQPTEVKQSSGAVKNYETSKHFQYQIPYRQKQSSPHDSSTNINVNEKKWRQMCVETL